VNWPKLVDLVFSILSRFGIKRGASQRVIDEKKKVDDKIKESDSTGRPS